MDIKNHLGLGKAYKIIGNDEVETEFTFKPLGIEHMADLYRYRRAAEAGITTPDDMITMVKLIQATIKSSYDWEGKIVNEFIANNFLVMVDIVLDLNQMGFQKSKKMRDMVAALNERRKNASEKVPTDTGPSG